MHSKYAMNNFWNRVVLLCHNVSFNVPGVCEPCSPCKAATEKEKLQPKKEVNIILFSAAPGAVLTDVIGVSACSSSSGERMAEKPPSKSLNPRGQLFVFFINLLV